MLLTVIIFILILAVLVLVHEFGHFIIAKISGIRVDEFALGFPPRLFSFKKGETKYSVNAVPFGGYVKIFGENPDDDSMTGPDKSRSFVHKSKWIQVAVLIAGIAFNIIFAWVLFSISFTAGIVTSVDSYASTEAKNIHLAIVDVSKDSPAEKAGLVAGDVITEMTSGEKSLSGADLTVENAQKLIAESNGSEIAIDYTENGKAKEVVVKPVEGIVSGKVAVGIAMNLLGTTQLPIHKAVWQGAIATGYSTKAVAVGLYGFFHDAIVGKADFSQVSGPVGIVGLVGDASRFGFFYLLSFTALISLNLAIINLLPFPALDGGRILFVIIEAIKGSPIKPKVANTMNAVGFFILIALMVIVTYKDIAKLIH